MKQKPITNWDDVPVIMDPAYVARLIGVTPTRVREMCREFDKENIDRRELTPSQIREIFRRGEIPCDRLGKLWRIYKEDLQNDTEDKTIEKVS